MAVMGAEYKLIHDVIAEVEVEARVEQQMSAVLSWPMQILPSFPEWGRLAAPVNGPGKLSLGDAWVASLALLHGAQLVHEDPELEAVAGLKDVGLPYNPLRRNRS
jgi:predicted nucleic acid-binding protein